MSLLKKLVDTEYKELRRFNKIADKIESLDETYSKMSDEELKGKTAEFKEALKNGKTLDDILVDAFATAREAAYRKIGEKPYRVQLLGGLAIHYGNIAEMKTGEGKTLTTILPAYLNALTGEGVHVVTVNEYLSARNAEWMGPIFEFLGLTVGVNLRELSPEQKREIYNCDITYSTNNEIGFDYLRDNMVQRKEDRTQRGLNYCIIDEIDSILIDEARTPLIISGGKFNAANLYTEADSAVKKLNEEEDFTVDEKTKTVMLTESGSKKIEKYFKLDNLYDAENTALVHHVNQALKANYGMKIDVDYVVHDGAILIVDQFTGRLMQGRQFSEGLHQAIEAKEGVKINEETKTLATITFQNLFRMYNKISGMTGTAKTEEEEFKSIYKMDVVVVPTNKPVQREDLPDVVYKNERGKFNAVAEDILERHKKQQPVLVGTVSIDKSEKLSQILKRKGIKHEVLNAKNHEKEAEIVAQAGRLGAVTIATNMAGRGTDIMLGGNPLFLTKKELKRQGFTDATIKRVDTHIEESELELDEELAKAKHTFDDLYEKYKEQAKKEQEAVRQAGGLAIIGTERHESRRIDNQLRGRSGRQGDPGSSRFYIGLDDELMRLFGSERIQGVVEKIGLEEDMPVEHKMLTKSIENAQKKVEGRNFGIRKHVLQYDDVMNRQRQVIYDERGRVLEGEDINEQIQNMIQEIIGSAVTAYIGDNGVELENLKSYLYGLFMPKDSLELEELKELNTQELSDKIYEIAHDLYREKEEIVGSDRMREVERIILLQCVDNHWIDHIDAMDQLRQGIGLRALGQQDPVIAYKMEGFDMFDDMVKHIQEDTVRYLFNITIEQQPKERQSIVDVDTLSSPSDLADKSPMVKERTVGRNEPCPCGSGKKFKHCCGK